jgi:hypothetical protein
MDTTGWRYPDVDDRPLVDVIFRCLGISRVSGGTGLWIFEPIASRFHTLEEVCEAWFVQKSTAAALAARPPSLSRAWNTSAPLQAEPRC